jgi:LPS-assembly lipoprotein
MIAKRPLPKRAVHALAALVLASAGVSACGFTPLYATTGLSSGLSAIDVIAPEGRTGYLLREELDDALARDPRLPTRWRLDLKVSERLRGRGLRIDNVASRYELTLVADYSLVEVATGVVAHRGQALSEVTYDSADQPYTAIATQQDADHRAAAEAARKIQLDLAVWLSRQR